MKKTVLFSLALAACVLGMQAQTPVVKKAKLHLGDDTEWAQPAFNDASWQTLDITQTAGYKEAKEDIRMGRVYRADSVEDMMRQILGD